MGERARGDMQEKDGMSGDEAKKQYEMLHWLNLGVDFVLSAACDDSLKQNVHSRNRGYFLVDAGVLRVSAGVRSRVAEHRGEGARVRFPDIGAVLPSAEYPGLLFERAGNGRFLLDWGANRRKTRRSECGRDRWWCRKWYSSKRKRRKRRRFGRQSATAKPFLTR